MTDSMMDQLDQASDFVRKQICLEPKIGMILGSGLSSLAEQITHPIIIAYDDIPDFPQSTVEGHSGRMIIGRLAEQPVLAMQGRVHYYEGYSPQRITFPIRIMQLLGIDTLLVTNAAGGINPAFSAGDLMLISDHINMIGMAGHNPLRGPNNNQHGVRFPDMSQAYDRRLRQVAREQAQALDISLQEGVYAMVAGPSFETPAEVRLLRAIGADAVGMSTAPEVVVARHANMRVLGVSLISNMAIAEQDADTKASHQQVLEAGRKAAPRMGALIHNVLCHLTK